MRAYFRPNAAAIDLHSDVFPTPGAPTKHKMLPLVEPVFFITAMCSKMRSFTGRIPECSPSSAARAASKSILVLSDTPHGIANNSSRYVFISPPSLDIGDILRIRFHSDIAFSLTSAGILDFSIFLRMLTESLSGSSSPISCCIARIFSCNIASRRPCSICILTRRFMLSSTLDVSYTTRIFSNNITNLSYQDGVIKTRTAVSVSNSIV